MVDANTIIDYNYDDFREGINTIVKQIKDTDFQPDYIVGIVRGGAVPAVYLSHKLKAPLVTVAWSTRDTSIYGQESNCWIPEDIIGGKKILIVDDIVDGGETIKELFDDWQLSVAGLFSKLPLDNLRVAAMYYNTAQDVKVDYYHRAIDRNEDQRWVIFPWEA